MLRSPLLAITALMLLGHSVRAEPAVTAPTVVAKADATLSESDGAAAIPEAAEPKGDAEAAPADGASQPQGEAAKAAEPAKPAPPPVTLTAAVNLTNQTLTVAENGVTKYTWPISSGTQSHPTPRGSFHPQWTAKMWYSRKYDNAPMPHAVFVHGGVAIHATYAVSMLGRPASHGCIRLSPSNAKTFYGLVQRHGLKSTRVSIYGSPKFGRDPMIASRKAKQRYAAAQASSGWDWFGSSSAQAPKLAPRPVYAKRGRAPVYYYAQNGNVYVLKPRRVGKRMYYNASGYDY